MSQQGNPKTRRALVLAIALNGVLAVALLYVWWHSHHATASQPATQDSSQMTAESGGNSNSSQGEAAASNEPSLAQVQLTSQRLQSIGVKLGTAELKQVQAEMRVTGNVDVDERRIAYVQTRFPGWIRKVYADATYQYIRKGQPLFTIYSPDLVTTEQEYLLAKKNSEQVRTSTVSGVSTGALALLSAARERLTQWEVPASEIEKLETTGKVITDLTFNSPVSGYITEKNALPNMYVQPESKLYTVADLSTVWVNAQIFQTDIGRIKPGDAAIVTVDAYPGKTFRGRVDFILPQVDLNTRTVRARLVFPNPGLLLKPGMFVNVVLAAPAGKNLTIAASSVFHSGNRNLVFVNKGEGNFEPREVELGPRVGDDYVVLKGIKPGESLVTSANFLIDSEAQLQAAAGAFVPPPPGAGAAAAMNAPAQTQATIDLTTDPSPPHKGSNTIRVKLASSDGKPITGAEITVTLFMPAMQDMGMAAMKTIVHASDKGGGLYEGNGDLGSGGTWQVTVTATQNGQVIVSKHLALNATGGM